MLALRPIRNGELCAVRKNVQKFAGENCKTEKLFVFMKIYWPNEIVSRR